ncbi:type VI secretion system tip protein VgrG [Lysobacteraceae bacterium NML03-0222]|nr:type VI secretion system tip protein VgrG [Xanthomonadaceae bacterium NML03-0222]
MQSVSTLMAALSTITHHERLLRLHTPLGRDVLLAEQWSGEETVDGEGFAFSLLALSLQSDLDLSGLIGQPVLLELQCSDGLRPFHARVLAASCLGSNGGLSRYRLQLAPWLSWLHQRVDSYVFQDKTVIEIVEDVLADYAALQPAWRWVLQDASRYARRSLTVQYEESDFAFVSRLLAEEGIFFWFEHTGAPDSPSLGQHTWVLADDTQAFTALGDVRFHRSDVTERADSVQGFDLQGRWVSAEVRRASWDYRQARRQTAAAASPPELPVIGIDQDTAGPYAWHDRIEGERRAQQHLDALQLPALRSRGEGSWRRLAPGGRFALQHHPRHPEPQLCLRVAHHARNNLGADIHDQLEQWLGPVMVSDLALPAALSGLGLPSLPDHADVPFYRNQFHSLPQSRPYRPSLVDGEGQRRHPKPRVYGLQSAIVVSDGEPVYSDRDHRIKVQFVWQRGRDASSGAAHPGGDDNAPGDANAFTWVRVATAWAGDNWGGVFLPRRGQEVLVGFLEGDIDRPVIVGSVYNGEGHPDAPHNRIQGGQAGATGNASAWFHGNAHAAVLTGFKSQALSQSQAGTGGYQLLRMDDTPGQGRIQAGTTQQASWLNLGHFKGGTDNIRGAERGYGFELRTDAEGAIRAGQGLLLATESGVQQLASPQALAALSAQQTLSQSLHEASQTQQANLPEDPEALPLHQAQKQLQAALGAEQQGQVADAAFGGGEGRAPGWSAPVLLGSGSDGWVLTTPATQSWVAGATLLVGAGQDLNWLSQGDSGWHSAGGVLLYSHGSPARAGKPVTQTGIALHAASGYSSVRAHDNRAVLNAKQDVELSSTQAEVLIDSPNKHVLLACQGAYIKLEGDNIELGAPGMIEFKASMKQWLGPQGRSSTAALPKGEYRGCEFKMRLAAQAGVAIV